MNEVERSKEEEKIKKKKEGPVSALLFFLKAGCSCTLAARPPACNGCVRVKEEKKKVVQSRKRGKRSKTKETLYAGKEVRAVIPRSFSFRLCVYVCVCVCVCVSSFSCRLSLSSSFFFFLIFRHTPLSLSLQITPHQFYRCFIAEFLDCYRCSINHTFIHRHTHTIGIAKRKKKKELTHTHVHPDTSNGRYQPQLQDRADR